MLVLEGLVGLRRTWTLLVGVYTWIECDIEWFTLEMNRDHFVVFEITPYNCILDSFVDYEGYSISSKRFLPVVVMVIWVKFARSSPFKFTDS